MAENITTNVMENGRNPKRTTNVEDQNNEGFSAVILAVILLACLWMLAGFTVFKYATLILLVAHFIKTFRLNSISNHSETSTISSSQICARCSRGIGNDSILNSLPINDHSPTIKVKGQCHSREDQWIAYISIIVSE